MKKILCSAALILMLLFPLQPAACAGGAASPLDFLAQIASSVSLRDFVDKSTNTITIAGSTLALDNILFLDDLAVGEKVEMCVCEVTERSMIVDESTLPAGCRAKIRREKVEEHIEEIEADRKLEIDPKNEEKIINPNRWKSLDPEDEAYYLYLTGKPTQEGSSIFVVWMDGDFFLCSVDVLPKRPQPAEPTQPAEQPVEPTQPAEQQVEQTQPAEQTVEQTQPVEQQVEQTQPAEQTWGFPFPTSGDWSSLFPSIEQPGYSSSTSDDWSSLFPSIEQPGYSSSTSGDWSSAFPSFGDWSSVFPSFGGSTSSSPAYELPTFTAPVYEEPAFAPSLTITGDTRCSPGDTVILEAYPSGSSNSAAAVYQWYTGMGPYSAPIDGATGRRYQPDTSRAGVWNFFCVAAFPDDGYVSTTQSESMTLTVAEASVRSVEIAQIPSRTNYRVGDRLDTGGLALLVTYSDGSRQYVYDGFTASPTVLERAGTQTIWIAYKGRNCVYDVTVTDSSPGIRGIGVLTLPNDMTYKVGDWLDTTGLSIRAYTNDGGYIDVSNGLECSPSRFTQAGRQEVTVSFANKTCTFTVTVEEDRRVEERRVTSLSIQTLPVNRSYAVGDTVNTTGLTLTVRTNNGYETVTSGYTVTPRVVTTPGTQTITVLYEGMSTTFTVDVREAAVPRATPTPAPTPTPFSVPTPTPAATAAAASAAPMPTSVPARRNTGVNTLVKVVFAVAVLSLGGLMGYIWYLRKRGAEEDDYEDDCEDEEPKPEEKLYDRVSRYKGDRRGR